MKKSSEHKIVPAYKVRDLGTYLFARIDDLKLQALHRNMDVIDLSMGNPDIQTPQHVVERLCEAAMNQPATHRYPQAKGIPKLRQAICDWYDNRFRVKLDPETQALALIGSKEGIAHCYQALLNPGDLAMVCRPCYPIQFYGIGLASAKAYEIPLEEKNGWLPDLGKIPAAVAHHAKILLLSYPNNPTGATVDLNFFKDIVKYAKKNGLIVLHDNAYSEIAFDGYKAPSFLQAPGAMDVGVEFHSCSKSYNMAGWRIGFLVGNQKIIGAVTRLKSYLDYGVPTFIQLAAITALTGPQECVSETVDIYRRRRDKMVDLLHRIGWDVAKPRATMYLWARMPEKFQKWGSVKFCEELLAKTGVALSPGAAFGPQGEGYVRIALVAHAFRFQEAVLRMERFVRG